MICHNSVGYDAQIKDLLIKSAFNMDKKEIDAWMKYQYDLYQIIDKENNFLTY